MQLRRTFTIDDPAALEDIKLVTRADDGVVLYLNGQEIARRNLPDGTLKHTTYATAAPRTATALATPLRAKVPASALRTGRNVLTAQVHLNYKATPDISFDAKLHAAVK